MRIAGQGDAMKTPVRTVAILSISLTLLGLSRTADAQGVVAGSANGGAVFNVPNERAAVGLEGSIAAERRSGLLGMGGGFEVIEVPPFERVYPHGSSSSESFVVPLGFA